MKSRNTEPISPTHASAKGGHPNWESYDESRWYWRKTFYINGKISGKRVKKKRRRFTRNSIKFKEEVE